MKAISASIVAAAASYMVTAGLLTNLDAGMLLALPGFAIGVVAIGDWMREVIKPD